MKQVSLMGIVMAGTEKQQLARKQNWKLFQFKGAISSLKGLISLNLDNPKVDYELEQALAHLEVAEGYYRQFIKTS